MRNAHKEIIDGPIIGRGGAGGRAGSNVVGRGVLRLFAVGAFGVALYWGVGTYRAEILALAPFAYPYMRAIGFEVEEPIGFGLRVVAAPRVVREIDARGQQTILLVQGSIFNNTQERRAVPKLRVTVTGSRGSDVTWNYEPPQTTIEPGGQIRFQSRFQHSQVVVDPAARIAFEKR